MLKNEQDDDVLSSDKTFQGSRSHLVKLSRTLVGFALRSCCSVVLQKAPKEASRPGWAVHVDLTRKGLGLS